MERVKDGSYFEGGNIERKSLRRKVAPIKYAVESDDESSDDDTESESETSTSSDDSSDDDDSDNDSVTEAPSTKSSPDSVQARGENTPSTSATTDRSPDKEALRPRGGDITDKNVPYTRNGDTGTSQLFTGERRSKEDAAFEAMGTVDELCCVVGVGYAELTSPDVAEERRAAYGELPDRLLEIMSRLFDVGSHIARPAPKDGKGDGVDNEADDSKFSADGIGGGFDACHTIALEEWIDEMTNALPELTSFVLPTGSRASAQFHVARTVCRRAERRTVPLVHGEGTCDPRALAYLNRLSDFFFVAARYANRADGVEELQYRRESGKETQRKTVVVKLND